MRCGATGTGRQLAATPDLRRDARPSAFPFASEAGIIEEMGEQDDMCTKYE